MQAAGGIKVLARLCEPEVQPVDVLRAGTAALAAVAVEKEAKVQSALQ